MATPVARAQINAYQGDTPDDLNQFLGTHASRVVWDSSTALVSPGVQEFVGFQEFVDGGVALSIEQPVALSGTIHRVTLPISIGTGLGCDLLVGLYGDGGGLPTGAPIAQTFVPKEAQLAAIDAASIQATPANFGKHMLSAWTPQASLPASLTNAGMASDGQTLFVVGGSTGTTASANVYAAPVTDDPPTVGAWATTTPLPGARVGCGVVISGETIIVAGGWDGNATLFSDVWSGTIENGGVTSWTAGASLPLGLFGVSLVVANGFIYAIGGATSATTNVASVYYASFSNGDVGSWAQINGLPFSGSYLLAETVRDTIFAGSTQFAFAIPDPTLGTINDWIPLPTNSANLTQAASAIVGDTIYEIAGVSGGGGTAATYSLTSNNNPNTPGIDDITPAWKAQSALPVALHGSCAASAQDVIVVAGGTLGGTVDDPTVVQYQQASTGATAANALSVSITSTAGNMLLACVAFPAPLTITDSASNTGWTLLASGNYMSIYACPSAAAVTSITATLPAGTTYQFTSTCFEISGVIATGITDITAYASSYGTQSSPWSHQVGPFSTVGDLLIAFVLGVNETGTNPTAVSVTSPTGQTLTTLQAMNYTQGMLNIGEGTFTSYGSLSSTDRITYAGTMNNMNSTSGEIDTLLVAIKPAQYTSNLVYACNANRAPSISVPLRAVSLASATYHVVVTPVFNPSQNDMSQIAISDVLPSASFPSTAHALIGETTWGDVPISSGYIPLSVYAQGASSRPIHFMNDTNTQGEPTEWGWITYSYWGQPEQVMESTVPNVNLLANNDSSFGGAVEGTTSGWTPTNATLSLVQLE